MENAKDIRDWCEEQWRGKLIHSGHGNVFTQEGGRIRVRGGAERNYTDKETKRRRAKLAMYNEKLRPIILAEATSELRNMVIPPKSWKDDETIEKRPHYTWPKQPDAAPVQQANAPAIPRKRVSKAKLDRAAAILEQVPADELAAFLARFGLSMSLAASIASLDNVEQIARQFLRATL